MIVLRSRRAALAFRWCRLLTLLLFGTLVGHSAVFAAQFGLGDGFREAMTQGGHDAYWLAFSLIVLAITSGVLTREAARAAAMWGRVRHAPAAARDRSRRPLGDLGFRREFRSIWPVLFVAMCIAFTVQENVEHIAAGSAPHGLGSLIGNEHPFALPVLAVVSALLGALGALIRWRVRLLEIRVAGTAHQPRRRVLVASPAAAWSAIAALRARTWFQVRLDAGRAPPQGL